MKKEAQEIEPPDKVIYKDVIEQWKSGGWFAVSNFGVLARGLIHFGHLGKRGSLVARRMDKVFAHAQVVVTPSASCAAMVRTHSASLPGIDRAMPIASKVVELAEYLVRIGFDSSRVGWPGHATYHPSCHGRDLGTPSPDPTLALLAKVEGLTLTPLPSAAQCCGLASCLDWLQPRAQVRVVREITSFTNEGWHQSLERQRRSRPEMRR